MASSVFPLDRYPPNTPIEGDGMHENIVAYCAEEVRRQGDTQWHVYRMYQAWMFAFNEWERSPSLKPQLTPALIRQFGKMIDEMNERGFRDTRIYISKPDGNHIEKMMPSMIDAAIDNLCKSQNKMEPIDLYAEFEEIHPFGDGNGRTGKIIYNWRRGTLYDPVWPRDLYGGVVNP